MASDQNFWLVDGFRPKVADWSEISIGSPRSTILGVFAISTFQSNFKCVFLLKLKKGRLWSIRGSQPATKIFLNNIGYKMLLKTNRGVLAIFWRDPRALVQAFLAPKSSYFWKSDFPSKMGKMSYKIWQWTRNSLQKCARTLKSSFRALLSFVAGVT